MQQSTIIGILCFILGSTARLLWAQSPAAHTTSFTVALPRGFGLAYEYALAPAFGLEVQAAHGEFDHALGQVRTSSTSVRAVTHLERYYIKLFLGLGAASQQVKDEFSVNTHYQQADLTATVSMELAFLDVGLMSTWYGVGSLGIFSGINLVVPIWWTTSYKSDVGRYPDDVQHNVFLNDAYWAKRQRLKRWSRSIAGFDSIVVYPIGFSWWHR